jgi:carbon storage regulator CsrA
MLVLRRSRGQSIVIDAQTKITVKILREEKGVITLGIDAPKTVIVDRLEVYTKRQANIEASKLSEEIKENQESYPC